MISAGNGVNVFYGFCSMPLFPINPPVLPTVDTILEKRSTSSIPDRNSPSPPNPNSLWRNPVHSPEPGIVRFSVSLIPRNVNHFLFQPKHVNLPVEDGKVFFRVADKIGRHLFQVADHLANAFQINMLGAAGPGRVLGWVRSPLRMSQRAAGFGQAGGFETLASA